MGISHWLKRRAAPPGPPSAVETGRPPVEASYWTGGKPAAYAVRDLSPAGAYIVTPDRWYFGTVVRMVLRYDRQVPAASPDNGNRCTTVHARVVSQGPDGVGVRFVFLTEKERRHFRKFWSAALSQERT